MIKGFILRNVAIWVMIIITSIIIKKLRDAKFEESEATLCWFAKIVLFIQCFALIAFDFVKIYNYQIDTDGDHSLLYLAVGIVTCFISWITTRIAVPVKGTGKKMAEDFPFFAIIIGLSVYYVFLR